MHLSVRSVPCSMGGAAVPAVPLGCTRVPAPSCPCCWLPVPAAQQAPLEPSTPSSTDTGPGTRLGHAPSSHAAVQLPVVCWQVPSRMPGGGCAAAAARLGLCPVCCRTSPPSCTGLELRAVPCSASSPPERACSDPGCCPEATALRGHGQSSVGCAMGSGTASWCQGSSALRSARVWPGQHRRLQGWHGPAGPPQRGTGHTGRLGRALPRKQFSALC